MTAKHTPGPWHRNICPVTKYPIIFAGRNTHVARVVTAGLTEPEAEANCALMTAAPDLLAAAVAYLEATPPPNTRKGSDAWDRLRAVIAKAEEC